MSKEKKLGDKYRKEKYRKKYIEVENDRKLKIIRENDVTVDWRHWAPTVQYCFPYRVRVQEQSNLEQLQYNVV